jgi:hypothetical protein
MQVLLRLFYLLEVKIKVRNVYTAFGSAAITNKNRRHVTFCTVFDHQRTFKFCVKHFLSDLTLTVAKMKTMRSFKFKSEK